MAVRCHALAGFQVTSVAYSEVRKAATPFAIRPIASILSFLQIVLAVLRQPFRESSGDFESRLEAL